MKKIIAIIIAAVISITICAGCDKKTSQTENENIYSEIDLVTGGQTEYSILLPETPQPYEETAAEELQTFFETATGISLDIHSGGDFSLGDPVFALGDTALKSEAGIDTSGLDKHGFIVRRSDRTVIIAGQDDRGTVYGVYEFLERQFNYHYYTGDEIVIDRVSDCKLIDADISDAPFMPDYWIGYETSESFYNSRLRYRADHDFDISRWPHSHFSFLPPDVYSAEHPLWYNSGKTALCLTNPEVMEEMAKVVIQFAEENPEVEYVMLGAEDSWAKCTCSNCYQSDAQYTSTGTDIIFNNYVADKLKEHFDPLGRTVDVVSLNYFNTEKPPVVFNDATGKYEAVDEKVIPHDNVYVHVCYISADYSASLTDSKRNAAQIVNLDGWKALTDNLTAYTYNGLFINEGLVFFDDFAYKSDYIKTFGEYGYKFVFMEGSPTRVATFEPMRAYVTAELFWDPDQDVNALTSDFIENYYKAAAPYIQEYYNKISLHMSEMKAMYEAENKNFGAYVQFEMNDYLRTARTWPQRVLEQYLELFDSAYEAVEQAGYDTDLYEKMMYRLRAEELSPRYLLLLLYKSSFTASEYDRLVQEFNEDSASLGSVIRL